MSQATAFIERIQTDAALRHKAQQASGDMDTFLRLAAAHGYTFTADEYLEAAKAYAEANEMELSEEDLAQVAGGALPGLIIIYS